MSLPVRSSRAEGQLPVCWQFFSFFPPGVLLPLQSVRTVWVERRKEEKINSDGTVETWSDGTVETWSDGSVETWLDGTVETWLLSE